MNKFETIKNKYTNPEFSTLTDELKISPELKHVIKFQFNSIQFNSKRFIETHTYVQQSYTMTVSRCLQTLDTRFKQKCIKFRHSETCESMRILEAVKGLWVLYLAL